jgi:MYXO-CTERM domain-containing protein
MLGAAAVSSSWGSTESGGDDDAYFACSNILVLASAGDEGYMYEASKGAFPAADFPASSPHVLAVGGTTLGLFTEVVWGNDPSYGNGSTNSGCSGEYAMPSYQSTSGFNFGGCTKRASNDVAAVADWNTGGIAVYNTDSSGWSASGGTSASSPVVAAIMVRLGLGGKDQHALFYANGGAFNDITAGNNDPLGMCPSSAKVLCNGEKGWDGPTGLGSPNGTLLLALAGGAHEPEPDAGPPDSGPPADAGVDSGGNKDAGMDASADAGHHKPPPAGGLGAPCKSPSQCASTYPACVPEPSGKGSICTLACDSNSPCPTDYQCASSGFCLPGKASGDAGSGFKLGPPSSGCGCSTAGSRSPWATAGWLGLGLLGLMRRRRT